MVFAAVVVADGPMPAIWLGAYVFSWIVAVLMTFLTLPNVNYLCKRKRKEKNKQLRIHTNFSKIKNGKIAASFIIL